MLQIVKFSVTYGFIPFAHKIESSTRYHLKVCPTWSVRSWTRLARTNSASVLLQFCFWLYTCHSDHIEEEYEFLRGPRGGHSPLRSPPQSSPTELHCIKTHNSSNHRHCRHMGKAWGLPCSSICHNKKFREQACQYRLPVQLTMTS
jgi:hypothetical protein